MNINEIARRNFLKFAAASPCAATILSSAVREALAQSGPAEMGVIGSPGEALSVFDFEEAAHRKVLPGHWAYMASGVDDDVTLRANREGFSHLELSAPSTRRDEGGYARQSVRHHLRQSDIHLSHGRRKIL